MVSVKPFKNSDNFAQDGNSKSEKKVMIIMIEILARQPKIKSNMVFTMESFKELDLHVILPTKF